MIFTKYQWILNEIKSNGLEYDDIRGYKWIQINPTFIFRGSRDQPFSSFPRPPEYIHKRLFGGEHKDGDGYDDDDGDDITHKYDDDDDGD